MWILFAVGASIFWGITYTISEHVYRHISVLTALAISLTVSGVVLGLIALGTGSFGKDIATLASSPKILWLFVAGVIIFIVAELLIGFSITSKNATVAGLIEISYPIFTILFSYLLFRENNLILATAIGGAFVFVGIGIIYAFNR